MLKVLLLIVFSCVSYTAKSADLTVLTEHLPPFQIADPQGKLIGGTSFLIVRDMLKQAGIRYQIQVVPWARAFDKALTEENIIIFSMFRTSKREGAFKWIGKLGQVQFRFYTSVTNKKRVKINNIEDALAYRAVGVRGSAEADYLLDIGFVENENLIIVKDYLSAWLMVDRGRADIIYAGAPFKEVIEQQGINKNSFYATPFIGLAYDLYVAASLKTSDDIFLRLQDALHQVEVSESFN